MTVSVLEAPAAISEGTDFTLKVYSKPDCVQCGATYRKAEKLRIQYVSATLHEDVELNQDAVRKLGVSLGVTSAPLLIVRTGDGTVADSWGGFNPPKMEERAHRLQV